jgi:hypothetical protein
MATKNKVEVEIDGKNNGAVKAINGVESAMAKLGGLTGSLDLRMLGVSLSVAGAATALVSLIKNAINTADEMYMMSQKVGISVESLSTLKYAADLSDVSLESLQTSLGKLSKNIFDFTQGAGEAKDAFRILDITTVDVTGKIKTADQVMLEVADRFEMMEDGSVKTALAMKLFGRSGAELIPMLNGGSKGIRELQDEAKALGLEISERTAKAAEEFNDNFTRLGYAMSGVGIQIAEELMPTLLAVSSAFVAAAANGGTVMTVSQGLGMSIKILATVFGGVAVGAIVAGQALGTYYAAMAKILTLNWDEVDDVIAFGFKNIKDTSLSAGAAFNALWGDTKGYMQTLEQLRKAQLDQQALEDERAKHEKIRKEAEALNKQWEETAATLKNDILLAGLDPFDAKLLQINLKAEDLKQKFAGIPGSIALINQNLQAQQAALISDAANKGVEDASSIDEDMNAEMFAKYEAEQTAAEETWLFKQGLMIAEFELAEELNQARIDMAVDGAGMMADAMSTLYQTLGEKNRVWFDAWKAFAIAEATINAYNAVLGAYKAGASLGGPILGAAYAAAAGIFSLAKIAQIASTQPGSRAGSLSASSSQPSISNNQQTTNNNNNAVTKNYTIVINSNYQDPDQLARDLIPHLKKAEGDGLG